MHMGCCAPADRVFLRFPKHLHGIPLTKVKGMRALLKYMLLYKSHEKFPESHIRGA